MTMFVYSFKDSDGNIYSRCWLFVLLDKRQIQCTYIVTSFLKVSYAWLKLVQFRQGLAD